MENETQETLQYEKPQYEILELQTSDILTASNKRDDFEGPGVNPWDD